MHFHLPKPLHGWREFAGDHLDPLDLGQYALMFNSFEDLAHARDEVVTEFAEATVGRLGGPADAATINRQLVAAERLRTHLTLQVSIAQTMIATANGTPGKWKPIKRVRWERLSEVIEQEGALCERTAMAVLKSAGQGAMRPRKSG